MHPNTSYLFIASKQVQTKLLLKISKQTELYDISWLTKEELLSQLTFSYTSKTIYEVMKIKKVPYFTAKIYLEHLRLLNLIDLPKQNYDKIQMLLELKEKLTKNKLIEENTLFKSYFQRKKVIIYSKNYLSNELYNYIIKFTKPIDYVDEYKVKTNKDKKVYAFQTMEEEIIDICENISSLLKDGIDISSIFITNVKDKYLFTLKRIFDLYSIPLNNQPIYSLFNSNLVQRIFRALNEKRTQGIEKVIKEIIEDDKVQYNDEEQEILNKFIQVINSLAWYQSDKEIDDEFMMCLKEELKKTSKPSLEKRKGINIIPFNDIDIDRDEYLFVLGFHHNDLPIIKKDEDYFSDSLRSILGLETTQEENKRSKEQVRDVISIVDNIYLSYCLKDSFDEYFPSNFINELNLKVEDKNIEISYFSNSLNEQLLYRDLDEYRKFGIIKNRSSSLYKHYYPKDYLNYRNIFSGIDLNNLYKLIDNKLSLSYTSINKYFECSFAYYLNYILKIDEYNDTFSTYRGRFYHYVLSHLFDDNFIFDDEVNNFLKNENKELNNKEKFYFEILTKNLKELVDLILDENQKIKYHNNLLEKHVEIKEQVTQNNHDFDITINGTIDRIVYQTFKDNNQDVTYLVLIDYKTGKDVITLDYIEDGLFLQLPVYLYLSKHIEELKNAKIYGFYLKHILQFEDDLDKRKKAMLLEGYTLKDCPNKYEFDPSPNGSYLIKSLGKKKDNTYSAFAKVKSEDEIVEIEKIADKKIHEALKNILDGKFNIEPKMIKGKLNSCEYCKFKNICYCTHKDAKHLDKKESLEGDNSEPMDQ